MTRRNTKQRDLVLATVFDLHNHATADQIYLKVAEIMPNIGKGTVYRNLNILADEGKIKRLSLPGQPDRFDHTTTKHHHIKCKKCGKIFDVQVKVSENLESSIVNNPGFEISDIEIVFLGLCPDCK